MDRSTILQLLLTTVARTSATYDKTEVENASGKQNSKRLKEAIERKPVSSAPAYGGWTPERSRCSSGANWIRVRLGTDRRLTIEYLDQTLVKNPQSE